MTEREPEGATFSTARVARRRDRSPLVAVGIVGVLGGLVLAGLGGRGAGPGTSSRVAASAAGIAAVAVDPRGRPFVPSLPWDAAAIGRSDQAPPAGEAPVISLLGRPIELWVQRSPRSMYIRTEATIPNVSWVLVTLLDPRGLVAGSSSITVPAGVPVADGPNLRFSLDIAIPADMADRDLSVQVTAYADGGLASSSKLALRADGTSVEARAQPFGARPGVFFPLLDASWEDRP